MAGKRVVFDLDAFIIDEIREYKKSPNALRDRYVAYIKDTGIPLDERWETFKEAPDDWKEHRLWVQTFDIEKTVGEISWYDDMYIEKYQTVDMVSLVEDTIADEIDDEDDEYDGPWNAETVAAFKEEILAKNLGSFVFDW